MRAPALVLAAILALALGAVLLRGGGDAGSRTVEAVFESTNGLIEGGQVRAGGLQIGTVEDVRLGDDGYPHVRLRIGSGYEVRRGATADLRLASQAGQLNRFVSIANGRGERLPDGATLGLARTDQPVELDDALSALTPRVREQVRVLVTRTARTLEGRAPDIARTLRHSGQALDEVAGLLGDVGADRAALRQLVTRADAATAQLAAQPAQLEAVVDRAARLLDVAAARRAETGQALDRLPGALDAARRTLTRAAGQVPALRDALRRVGAAAGPITALAVELGRTARASPQAFGEARALVRAFRQDGRTLQTVLHEAGPVVDAARPALTQLNPVLDQLRPRVADALGWLTLLGDASANYDAAGHGIRVMGVLPEVSRRLTSSSADCTSGLLRRPFDRIPGTLACDPWTGYLDSFVGGGLDPRKEVTPADTASRDRDLK